MTPQDDDAEACSCEVCASVTPIARMTSEERQAYLDAHWPAPRRDTYSEQLEAENYDLRQQVKELEEENAKLLKLTECPKCGWWPHE